MIPLHHVPLGCRSVGRGQLSLAVDEDAELARPRGIRTEDCRLPDRALAFQREHERAEDLGSTGLTAQLVRAYG